MKKSFLLTLLVIISTQFLFAATSSVLEKHYSPDLSKIGLISCKKTQIDKRVITALPLKSGAVMVPVNKSDLTCYDRVKIKITPIDGNFQESCFGVALRDNGEYSIFARFAARTNIKKNKPFEMSFNIANLPRTKVTFLRLYFNRLEKVDKLMKFQLDSIEFYQSKMFSKLPLEKYQRKLAKTMIFPRIQIKYNLFMNYYPVSIRDLWIERPLLFNRELSAGTKEIKKEGNLASFEKNAEIVSSYLDGFSILVANKNYLQRTLAAMRYADTLGLNNFLLLEISPSITELGGVTRVGKNYDFMSKLIKAAEKSSSIFRINDKIVLSSYNANLLSPEQWIPVIKELKEQAGGNLIFIPEIRKNFYEANNVYCKNGGKIPSETIDEMKKFIRSYLDVSDGMLFAGCNHIINDSNEISSYKFGNAFYKDILIPTIISVFNEPKYKSKYLGLSAAKGYFQIRHAATGQDEGGTLTLRQSLGAALDANPDFIIMPEWNEFHENTHIEPTIYDSFTNRRVINYYRKRKAPAMSGNNKDLPDLIISYRSELVYGEILTIELLNLPDPNYKSADVKVKLCLKNSSGKVVKHFEPLILNNRKLDEKYLKIPTENFSDERVLIPELSVAVNGKMQLIKGLSCIMLKTPPNMNKKYVKQPIRDLCNAKKMDLRWAKTADGVKIDGAIETGSPLNTVELLENNIPVAAVDVKNEYQCGPGEVLLRFCWNSGASSGKAVACEIKPISGSVSEIKDGKTGQNESFIRKNLRFRELINDFFFKAGKSSELEISVGTRKVRFPVAELLKFGIYRKVFSNSDTIAVERVIRLPEVPYPVNQKRIDFTLNAKSIFSVPVYTMRVVTIDGKIFRSQPFCPEKLSGKKVCMNVKSYSKQKVATMRIPDEYGYNVRYDFTAAAGDVLPTTERRRFLYGKLGGFDRWSSSFNTRGMVSAPSWKVQDNKSVLEFDGIGNYLVFPSFLISEQSFTLAFSIMPRDNSKQVVFQTYSSSRSGFQLILENGSLSGYFLNRKGKIFEFKTNSRLSAGKWNNIKISYDMKNISLKVNDNNAEKFKCNGILFRQPCLIFGGSYPPKGTHRFKGLLQSFSFANYML